MALIGIEGMEFHAYHGCFKEEQIIGTKFEVDFYYDVDTNDAEESDDLNQTVDYQAVYNIIKIEMAKKSALVEHVARRCMIAVIEAFPQIEDAEIVVSKLNPPVGGKMDAVSVTLKMEDMR